MRLAIVVLFLLSVLPREAGEAQFIFRVEEPVSCDQTFSSSTGLATAIANAANNTTICLNAGSYGNINLWDMTRTGYVTVRSTSGVASDVTVRFNPGNSDYMRFQYLTLSGATVDSCSTNIQFLDNDFEDTQIVIRADGGCSPTTGPILLDGNLHADFDAGGGIEGRVEILSISNVTVRNSTFYNGGCSDGIQLSGVTTPILLERNTFTDLLQGACGPHVDAIQLVSGSGVTITESYFENNSVSIGLYDGGDDLIITKNVFIDCPRNFQMGDVNDVLIAHNTARDEGWEFSADPPGEATGVILENNIFDNTDITDSQGNFCGSDCVIRYNLLSRGGTIAEACSNCVTGDADYIGGNPPTTWAGWQLDTGSPGENAGNDGQDMGTTYYGP